MQKLSLLPEGCRSLGASGKPGGKGFPLVLMLPYGSLPFPRGWEGSEMQLSGLGLGKWAAGAFWPSLLLSCSGLRTQTKEVSEETASSTALKLGMEPNVSFRDQINCPGLPLLYTSLGRQQRGGYQGQIYWPWSSGPKPMIIGSSMIA